LSSLVGKCVHRRCLSLLTFAGHVDAGKSTLMGRMLYDCGAVDERVIRKFRQESEMIGKGSFALAWVLDQTDEERTRYEC
jgi:elongation factor 1 alpha-like protein